MRYAGRLREWNDDKGFGFVTPNGGGTEAFVHIKAFASASRRPVAGDLISYELGTDDKGRPRALQVRFAGEPKASASSARSRPLPRKAIGLSVLAAIVASAALAWIPVWLAMVYVVMSLLAFWAYARDKHVAETGGWRIPESNLQTLGLLCGWPGALVAQQRYRHKTAKTSFQATFWLTVVLNVLGVALLLRSDLLQHMAS